MKVILRTLNPGKQDGTIRAEEDVRDGHWIDAVEVAYNNWKGYPIDQHRVLVVDDYRGGGFQQPVGQHSVILALYDDEGKRYIYDDPIRVEVVG